MSDSCNDPFPESPNQQLKSSRCLKSVESMPTVAVIGAGISGLMSARTLADRGFSVTVFEKSRGVGGRMSTRRNSEDLQFDHGAQYFTVRDQRTQQYLRSWTHEGIVAKWKGSIVTLENGRIKEQKKGNDRYVATPSMNALCKHLAKDLDVQLQTQIARLEQNTTGWKVISADGSNFEPYDVALVSAPAAQTAALVPDVPSIAEPARKTKMNGCWALMLTFAQPLHLESDGADFDGAFVHNSPISWVAKNSSKPGRRPIPETWVLHASAEWTEAHIELHTAEVEALLLSEFWRTTGALSQNPTHISAHRWRFAIPPSPLPEACLFDEQRQIGACGDWCGGPRVEGAILSGLAAAGRVIGLWNEPYRNQSSNGYRST